MIAKSESVGMDSLGTVGWEGAWVVTSVVIYREAVRYGTVRRRRKRTPMRDKPIGVAGSKGGDFDQPIKKPPHPFLFPSVSKRSIDGIQPRQKEKLGDQDNITLDELCLIICQD